MKKISLSVFMLSLVILAAGCNNKTNKLEEFVKENTGSWYRHGNMYEDNLIISEDGTWEHYDYNDEDGQILLSAKGTIIYDKEDKFFGFEDEMSNKTYICYPTKEGILEYASYKYILEEYSELGLYEYMGNWYEDGDVSKDYFRFEGEDDGSVTWKFFKSDEMAHISVNSGYLIYNGQNNTLIAEEYPDAFAVFKHEADDELSSNRKVYIHINNGTEDYSDDYYDDDDYSDDYYDDDDYGDDYYDEDYYDEDDYGDNY